MTFSCQRKNNVLKTVMDTGTGPGSKNEINLRKCHTTPEQNRIDDASAPE